MDFKKPRNTTKSKFDNIDMDEYGNEAVCEIMPEEIKQDHKMNTPAIAG